MVNYFDNKVPHSIHNEVYEYVQGFEWQSKLRHVPNSNDRSNDLLPYVAKKTSYLVGFGKTYEELQIHTPVCTLFDCINETVFDNKFELSGAPLGNATTFANREKDDYIAEQEFKGTRAYLEAQPYETVKRTRVPYKDMQHGPDQCYTIVFVANLEWNPIWQAEMVYFNNQDGWVDTFINNIPGRVILHDSNVLHNSKPTSTYATELAQRIEFRVRLKEGESIV